MEINTVIILIIVATPTAAILVGKKWCRERQKTQQGETQMNSSPLFHRLGTAIDAYSLAEKFRLIDLHEACYRAWIIFGKMFFFEFCTIEDLPPKSNESIWKFTSNIMPTVTMPSYFLAIQWCLCWVSCPLTSQHSTVQYEVWGSVCTTNYYYDVETEQ